MLNTEGRIGLWQISKVLRASKSGCDLHVWPLEAHVAGGIVCQGLLEGPDRQHTRLQLPPAGGLVCQNASCSGAGCRVSPESRRWAGEANNNRKLYPGWPVKQRQDIRCPNHSRRAKSCCSGTQTSTCLLCCSGRRHQNACFAARGRRHTMSAVNPLATSRPRDLERLQSLADTFMEWHRSGRVRGKPHDTFRQCIPALPGPAGI